jgi:hypothetical protein
MKKNRLYAEIRCKCCNKKTKNIFVGTSGESGDKEFDLYNVITKLYTDFCEKCNKFTVWEVIAYLGADLHK